MKTIIKYSVYLIQQDETSIMDSRLSLVDTFEYYDLAESFIINDCDQPHGKLTIIKVYESSI